MFGDVRVDALEFVDDQPSTLGWSVGLYNSCTQTWERILNPLGTVHLTDAEFRVAPSGDAYLAVDLQGWNAETQSLESVTFNLVWDADGFSGRAAPISGTVIGETFQISFDSTIQWHAWGDEFLPWSAVWYCRHDVFGRPPASWRSHRLPLLTLPGMVA